MILIFSVASLLGIFLSTLNRHRRWMSFVEELKTHQWLFMTSVAALIASWISPSSSFEFLPFAKQEIHVTRSAIRANAFKIQTEIENQISLPIQKAVDWEEILKSLWMLSTLLQLAWLSKNYFKLKRVQKNSYLAHRLGRTRIFWNEDITIPFSYSDWNHAGIVLPLKDLDKTHLQVFLQHEAQHIRNRDPQWLWLLQLSKVVFFWNPLFRLWSGKWIQLQELACDEALLSRKRVSSHTYASCLLEVAQILDHSGRNPSCTTGFSFWMKEKLLKRRIKQMFQNVKPSSRMAKWAMASVAITALSFSSWAEKQWAQDRTISESEAQVWLKKATASSEFPLTLNHQVLRELNRYAGTIEGRKFMKESLSRMETYQPMITVQLKKHQLPGEMVAIPLVESGYQNLEDNGKHGRGAGLWMFIPSSARRYGMKVDEKTDDRMNPEIETAAAARYLKHNYGLFKDWNLAVLAYNTGEAHVGRGLAQTKKKNAWDLINSGVSNDEGYLAKVIASIIIMKNPKALD